MVSKKNTAILFSIFIAFVGTGIWVWIDSKPKCQSKICNDRDPINQRCDRDAIVLIEENFDKNIIQLKYSQKCDASWVKADVPPGSFLYLVDTKGNKFGEWQVPDKNNKIAGFQFGNMGFSNNFKACSRIPGKKDICTKMFDYKHG
jgi:Protein of unknown function (DUF2690)